MDVKQQLRILWQIDRIARAWVMYEADDEEFMRLVSIKRGIGRAVSIATGQVARWTPDGYRLRLRHPGRKFARSHQC